MAKTKISEFSTTPGNNTDINGINIAEGCAPSGINNAIRELMSDLKEWQSGAMDVYVIPQGTAAAPGIQLYGDLDTGLYGFAANQLGVAVGGASAGYFSSAGWVGNVNGTITGDINATTIDTTNLEVTNIKAKDGTAAITIADSTGVVSVSTQLAVDNLNLSGNTLSSSDTNGNIILAPNGTGDVYLDADTIRVGDSNTNVTITSNGTADLILNTNSGTNSGSITIQDGVNGNILIATNGTGQIQLTGDLDVANIETGAIKARDGTASATIANSTGVMTIASSVLTTTDINGGTIDNTVIGGATTAAGSFTTVTATQLDVDNLRFDANTISSTNTNGNIQIAPAGTGDVYLDADTVRIGDLNSDATLTTNGTADLILNTNSGSLSGSITIQDGVNGNILISPNGTGQVQLSGALDVTNIEVTNIKAKDGTAALSIADSTGAVTVATALTANGGAVFNENGANVDFRVEGDTDANLIFADASADQVGVGTNAPAFKVDVIGSGTYQLHLADTAANYSNAGIVLGAQGTSDPNYWGAFQWVQSDQTLRVVHKAFNAVGGIALYTGTTGTPTEKVRLTSTGTLNIVGAGTAGTSQAVSINGSTPVNTLVTTSGGLVGIGTDTPAAGIGFSSNVRVLGIAGSAAAATDSIGALVLQNNRATPTSSDALGNINFASTNNTQPLKAQIYGILSGSGGGTGGFGGNIVFATRADNSATLSDRMTLDSSGNLGLGVTPSASWSGATVFQTTGGASFFSVTSGGANNTRVANNALWNGSGWRYIATDFASMTLQTAGSHYWYNAPSGTAGNAITFTQAMTLDASGNLLVGTTTTTNNLRANQKLAIVAAGNNTYTGAAFTGYSGTTSAAAPVLDFNRSRGTTDGSMTVVASGDRLGLIFARGSDGTNFVDAASIDFWVDGTPGSNDMPGRIVFSTTADGASSTTERARITSGGYFKASNNAAYVGSTDPYHELNTNAADWTAFVRNTNATTPYGLRVFFSGATPNGTGSQFFYCSDSTALRAEIRSNGGIANYSANNVALSDQRVKKDIVAAPSYWDKIKNIEIVHFKYKDQTHDDNNVGVIAQQVEQVAPEFVDPDGWGETPEDGVPLKSIYTSDMYHAAIKALQEAMARIEKLEAEVAALKGV